MITQSIGPPMLEASELVIQNTNATALTAPSGAVSSGRTRRRALKPRPRATATTKPSVMINASATSPQKSSRPHVFFKYGD